MMQQSQAAWAPYELGGGRPWNLALAAHLLRRAGFGANWTQLQQALADGPQRTVERLFARPSDLDAFERRVDALGAAVANAESGGSHESAELWLYRMLQTPFPLLEKMTLFWHDYFAVAGAQVGKPSLIERRLRMLRGHALGRFDRLLHDVSRDPATLIALDARANRKAQPAEGFAAALAGRDGDIHETARAFTGWFVLRDEVRYLPDRHDPGAPSLDDALRSLLANPATPRRVVRKMYRWLIAEMHEPADALVYPLAEAFARDYDIARLVGTMLRSNHFCSPLVYRQRVKSPVEYALGIVAAFDLQAAPAALHRQLGALGQDLLEPPTREGWAGGRRWLNRFTLVARRNLAEALLAGAKEAARLPELLLQQDVPGARGALELVTMPEFQLA
jgi:uncharacterized protein (DUF1800 family)